MSDIPLTVHDALPILVHSECTKEFPEGIPQIALKDRKNLVVQRNGPCDRLELAGEDES